MSAQPRNTLLFSASIPLSPSFVSLMCARTNYSQQIVCASGLKKSSIRQVITHFRVGRRRYYRAREGNITRRPPDAYERAARALGRTLRRALPYAGPSIAFREPHETTGNCECCAIHAPSDWTARGLLAGNAPLKACESFYRERCTRAQEWIRRLLGGLVRHPFNGQPLFKVI